MSGQHSELSPASGQCSSKSPCSGPSCFRSNAADLRSSKASVMQAVLPLRQYQWRITSIFQILYSFMGLTAHQASSSSFACPNKHHIYCCRGQDVTERSQPHRLPNLARNSCAPNFQQSITQASHMSTRNLHLPALSGCACQHASPNSHWLALEACTWPTSTEGHLLENIICTDNVDLHLVFKSTTTPRP